ncbi:MAG: hypothetical protein PVJ57_05140 [Phycisphaerae bacterium]|jgi:hypothetical protein
MPPEGHSVENVGEAPLDEHGRLAEDRRCCRCGYNLRGLDPAGDCPECAAPVSHSLAANGLRYADRSWLGKVRAGLLMLLVGVGSLCASLLSLLPTIIALATSRAGESIAGLVACVTVLGGLGGTALMFGGLLVFTAREPTEQTGRVTSCRRATRGLTLVLGVLGGILILPLGVSYGLVDTWFSLAVTSTGLVVGLATLVTASQYMRHLIERGGADAGEMAGSLAALALIVGTLIFVCCVSVYAAGYGGGALALVSALPLLAMIPMTAVILFLLVLRAYRVVDQAWRDDPDRYGQTPGSR